MRTIWVVVGALGALLAGCGGESDPAVGVADAALDAGEADAARCFPTAEACNARDDDCDGRVDEGAEGLRLSRPCYDGPAGTEALGACRAGRQVCTDGVFATCADAVLPGAEACNTVDDDCDGRVDEGACGCTPDAVQACGPGAGLGGVGTCTAGRSTCGPDRTWGPCVGGLGPRDETCDGADEDCDGRVDEVAGLGEACVVGEGVCARDGVLDCVAGDPRLRCVAPPGPPVPEVCDGVDQDCDGRVDEQVPRVPCAAGEGRCRREGATRCADGEVVCGAEPGAPGREACDGVDDDCDGRVDEGTRNTCGTCGPQPVEVCNGRDDDCDGAADELIGVGERCTVGVGACVRADRETCVGGRWICDVQPHAPQPEGCNALDDDCDGAVDEGVQNACGRCGVLIETCNDLDDDCDGRTDEGFDVGVACSLGTGACARQGVRACRDGRAVCPVEAGAPREETCNGLDDDCDGPTDEGFEVGAGCSVGLGACARRGVGACLDGEGICDAPPAEPGAEVCNDLDDDCDGATDEGLPQSPCGGCGPAPEEVCNDADDDCDGRIDEHLPQGPCGNCLPTPRELCNGVDDDCDGAVDETLINTCGTCGPPPREVCNRIDDDCDGGLDEGLPLNVCGLCDGLTEICDGADDDCDGRVDEGLYTEGVDCERLELGLCHVGRLACVDGGDSCLPVVLPTDEICNGLDEDCDGHADEQPFTVLELSDATWTGAAAPLVRGDDGTYLAIWGARDADQVQRFHLRRLSDVPALLGPTVSSPPARAVPAVVAADDGWLLAAARAGGGLGTELFATDGLEALRSLAYFDGEGGPVLTPFEGGVVLFTQSPTEGLIGRRLDRAGRVSGPRQILAAPAGLISAARLGDGLVVAYGWRAGVNVPFEVELAAMHEDGDGLAVGATRAWSQAAVPTLVPVGDRPLLVTGGTSGQRVDRVGLDLEPRPVDVPWTVVAAHEEAPDGTWLVVRLRETLPYDYRVLHVDADGRFGPAQSIGLSSRTTRGVARTGDAVLALQVGAERPVITRTPLCTAD